MKKTILFVAPTLEKGGMERQLSLMLPEIVKEYTVYLALYMNRIEYDLPENVTIIDLKRKTMGWDPLFEFRLFYTILKIKPNLIFSTILGVNNYCQIFGSILRIPVIASMRNVDRFRDYKKINIINKIFKFNRFICNTRTAKNQLAQYCNIKKEIIDVIPNGIDINRFKMKQKNDMNLLFDNKMISEDINRFKLLFVGRIIRHKNIHIIIDTLSKVKSKSIIFTIIGKVQEQEYFDYCKEISLKKGLNDRIFWEQPKNNIEDYYNWADCLILPSLREGTSNVLLEAMACGLPILVSESADRDNIVTAGKNGYRFNLDEPKILRNYLEKIKSEDSKEQFQNNNIKKIKQNYSLELLYLRTKKCIESML
jgi:glycosyltransferase involved in cell wall biosynthesis